MPGSCPNFPLSPTFSQPSAVYDSSRLRLTESFRCHLTFKSDPHLFGGRRENCRNNIHGFYAKMKCIAFGVVAMQDVAGDRQLGYRVQEGDTLTAIASKFNTNVQNIAHANKIVDVDYVPAGKLLLIPLHTINSDKVRVKDRQISSIVRTTIKEGIEAGNAIVESENTPLISLKLASTSITEILHHEEVVLEELKDEDCPSRLKRWEGILEDRRLDEDDKADFSEQINLELEEEKLQKSYAQLESRYLQFLADSGLSTSGYWRGGAPPASDDD